MNYDKYEINYPSTNGRNTVFGVIYKPKTEPIRGIVQLSHGMIDYVERYEALADYLTGVGYVFAGNHHIGHGKTALNEADFGYFDKHDGINFLLKDLHQMNRLLRAEFPGVPVILMGHSMGSFLSRLYIERYAHTVVGHIIHGTGGPHKVILPIGKALIKFIELFRGDHYRSKLIDSMAFAGYNAKFKKSEGRNAWLTREVDRVNGRENDPYTRFIFTLSGYNDLFQMITLSNAKKWYQDYPKAMNTLIMSGDMDPVGQYGRGVNYVYKHLLMSGTQNLTLKMYPGARHELFNETCRDEVFRDMAEWLDKCVDGAPVKTSSSPAETPN